MKKKDIEKFYKEIIRDLNSYVFPVIGGALAANPSLRSTLHPAFPFPQKLRIGLLETHLVVEYVGPENPEKSDFDIEGIWQPASIYEFLGIDFSHLKAQSLPFPISLENIQFFLGNGMDLLGDYLYDVVANPNDLFLNMIPEIGVSDEPTYISNTTFIWSDQDDHLCVRRIDFLEIFPIHEEGWAYHTKDSYRHFANFLINYEVPKYSIDIHSALNGFIELISDDRSSEPQITKYLESHPEILQLSFGTNELNPQTDLVWQYPTDKDDLKPDFMPIKMDGYADIIEFKLPRFKAKPIVGKKTRSHVSYEIDVAIAQIDEYANWVSQDVNRTWLEKTKGIKVYQPNTYLVIGHSSEFSAKDRQRFRSRRNATVFTYDEFIELARMQLYRIR
ncbi:MAG: DUF4263 domain-containing protein [Candidatus Marinimicrobia bacterium]|nr:DUF4263 domain-containing protein [Candidatus Neomarinimicrobiota bacterium]